MRAFITRAVLVLSLALAAAGMSGCVIHAHHTDGNPPAKTKTKKKTHKAKPPATKKQAKPVTEAKPASSQDRRQDPPPPPDPR